MIRIEFTEEAIDKLRYERFHQRPKRHRLHERPKKRPKRHNGPKDKRPKRTAQKNGPKDTDFMGAE